MNIMISARTTFGAIMMTVLSLALVSCGVKNSNEKAQEAVETSAVTSATTSATTLTDGGFTVEKGKHVLISTTMGDIEVILYNNTPGHRDNFLKLVQEQKFDSLLFHRVIPDFMIQAGDPDSKNAPAGKLLGDGSIGEDIPAEFYSPYIFHKRGALAAAREGDNVNPERKSSSSQFYIVWGKVHTDEELTRMETLMSQHYSRQIRYTAEQREAYTTIGGTPHLDGDYTVFGEITEESFKTVEAIQAVKCDENDRPLTDVRILGTKILE